MTVKTGVYICHCGSNIAGIVDVVKLTEYAADLSSVVIARHHLYTCSDQGQEIIKQDIKKLGLNRIVVASCSPRMHELTFRRAVQDGGLNPYLYAQVNIREHCSWVHEDTNIATEKAKDLVRAGVRRVLHQEPLEIREAPVNPNVLVVGGGIAGISAALKIADAKRQVYLVEREPSIGGHMAQLDKTFPTLDCSACILTPKMTDTGQHSFINLMSYSEVEEVSGYVGNFKAKIRRKARYVDEVKCTGCSDCFKVCPVSMDSEFDEGMGKRHAIYTPFPYAVPNKATIDKRGYAPCRLVCPAGVNAPGYIALISQGKFREALELVRRTMPFAGVIGRVCTRPCEAECERQHVDESMTIQALKRFISDFELQTGREKVAPVELTHTDKVAVIGSGPAGLACAYDLIRKGYPVTVFEAMPLAGGLLCYGIPAYRLPPAVLNNEIGYLKELGVEIKTDTPVKDLPSLSKRGYRAIFLGTGAWVSKKLSIPGEDVTGVLHALDFLKQVTSKSNISLGNRVVVIGGGNAAVDAARTAWRLGTKEVTIVYRRSRIEMPAAPEEITEAEREGIKLYPLAAPTKVLSQNGKVTGIECLRMKLGDPDESGRHRPVPILKSEFTLHADNVIIAIGQAVDRAGLLEEMTFTDRDTLEVDPVTYETDTPGIFAGGDVTSGAASVITAIAAGKEAAESIDRYLNGANLRQGRPKTTFRVKDVPHHGVLPKARAEMPLLSLEERTGSFAEVETGYDEKTAIAEAGRCLNCAGCAECLECTKSCEAGAINHDMQDETMEVDIGSIIVATGFKQFDAEAISQYGYGRYDNVITGLQFERLSNASGPTGGEILLKDGRKPESVAIIHCVGSRDNNYREYCSRVCCMYALKDAHLIREKTGATVYELYIDMRCFGEGYEEFYKRLSEEGIHFVRGKPSQVTDQAINEEDKGKLTVVCENTLLGNILRIPVDMVILCTALEPRSDTDKVSRLVNIGRRLDGFFQERHLKLDPVATPTSGVFVVGCCEGPRDISDTVSQALAGAAEALSLIGRGKITMEAATATIDTDVCIGCGRCQEVCEFHALEIARDKRVVPVCQVNEFLCQGCGACAVACPTGAMTINHFTEGEILSTIEALTEVMAGE